MTHIRYEYTEHWTMNILNGAMNIVGLITLEIQVDISLYPPTQALGGQGKREPGVKERG